MEKKDFEKTSAKVAEMNKHFRNECYNFPYKVYKEDKYYKEKKYYKEDKYRNDLSFENGDYDIVCVIYYGGKCPKEEYCLDRIYSDLVIYDIYSLIQKLME